METAIDRMLIAFKEPTVNLSARDIKDLRIIANWNLQMADEYIDVKKYAINIINRIELNDEYAFIVPQMRAALESAQRQSAAKIEALRLLRGHNM